MRALSLSLAAVALLGVTGLAQAETRNPVFGTAIARATTAGENKAIVGKGAYADYYGYYGNLYNSNAATFGNFAYNYKSGDYYTYASNYAGYASTFYSYAAYYQYNGY